MDEDWLQDGRLQHAVYSIHLRAGDLPGQWFGQIRRSLKGQTPGACPMVTATEGGDASVAFPEVADS